jgi:hypothetical protein
VQSLHATVAFAGDVQAHANFLKEELMLELIELLSRIWIRPGKLENPKPIGPEHWRI